MLLPTATILENDQRLFGDPHMSSSDFEFRGMGLDDVEEAAIARSQSAEYGFFAKIDRRFWREFFLAAVHEASVVALVARDRESGRLAGYILGTADATALKRMVLREMLWPLIFYTCKMLLRHPPGVRILRALVVPGPTGLTIPAQRWVTWVVSSEFREKGIGFELYRRLCTAMYRRGVLEFYGPVECDNTASNRAHEKMQAENLGITIVSGKPHYLWKHSSQRWASSEEDT